MSQSDGKWFGIVAYVKEKMTLQNDDFFFFLVSSERLPIELFTFPICFKMPDDCRMANTGFFSNFLCSCKRVSFDDALSWWLSASDGWPLCLLIFKALRLFFENFLNHHCVHSLSVPGPNALMLQVVFAALQPILNSKDKKIAWICFCLTSFP